MPEHQAPSEKEAVLKANYSCFEWKQNNRPFSEGSQDNFERLTAPKSVSIHLNMNQINIKFLKAYVIVCCIIVASLNKAPRS